MDKEVKRIHREEIYKAKIFTLAQDTIRFPKGNTSKWDVILHSGGAAILPIDKDGNVILVEQYRPIEDGPILEIPAGKLEPREDPMECAAREIEEETGYIAQKITPIGGVYSAVGYSNEEVKLFLGEDLIEGKINLDEDEYVSIKRFPLKKLVDMVLEDEIKDSKTVAAILKVNEILNRKQNNLV